jgi:uncharacterized protein DUF2252
MNIVKSTQAYDRWLVKQLGGDVFRHDLASKHEKMADDPFQFLRATYWRWAETIFAACPQLKGAPQVLAVGDIHVENFGTWRDREGRLVWGVNDFDEAARMPYPLDIVRLAVSAVLAHVRGITARAVCTNILKGYSRGLADPKPFVLDRHSEWLRDTVVVTNDQRKDFWKKFDPTKINAKAKSKNKKKKGKNKKKKWPKVRPARKMRRRYRDAIDAAKPDSAIVFEYFERTAGTGSLGRPRYFGVGHWRSDLVVREAKAMVRSSWTLAHRGPHRLRCEEIAAGRFRCPDPFYHLRGRVLVRRLTPNDYKIEATPKLKKAEADSHRALPTSVLVNPKMLEAMGRDLAAIHRGTPGRRKAISADLVQRKANWLLAAVTAARNSIEAEWSEWSAYHKRTHAKRATKASRTAG